MVMFSAVREFGPGGPVVMSSRGSERGDRDGLSVGRRIGNGREPGICGGVDAVSGERGSGGYASGELGLVHMRIPLGPGHRSVSR